MIKAQEALKRLQDGNRRFVDRVNEQRKAVTDPLSLPQQQAPFAIVLGCSDARVPAEIVFDQGPGDLFVIRVAGNIVAPSQLGSIEFAAGQFGTRLVVVLGHSHCGAVQATLRALRDREQPPSPNLRSIVNFIRPALESLAGNAADAPDEELMQRAVAANIQRSVQEIRRNSSVIKDLVENDELLIIGAEYSLKTGRVRFLTDDNDVPTASA